MWGVEEEGGVQCVLEGHGSVVYLDCDAENRCICISNLFCILIVYRIYYKLCAIK